MGLTNISNSDECDLSNIHGSYGGIAEDIRKD